jgi:hypothetical protein
LRGEESFVEGSESFESEAEPSFAVVDTVGGVKGSRKELAESIETGDASPGQLRVRDIIISEGFSDVD